MADPKILRYDAMSREELLRELRERDEEDVRSMPLAMDLGTHREELRVQSEELRVQSEALSDKENELELALARYTELYDSAPLGYVTLDESGHVAEVNLTGARLIGTTRELIIGVPFSRFVMPQDLRAFHAHLQACRSRQETVLTSLSIATLDGAVIPVQLASRPSTAGLEYRLLTTITDMSERERADAEIRRLNAELEQRVIERTRELESANAALSAENARRGEIEQQLKGRSEALEEANRALHKAYEDARTADRARLDGERSARMEAEKASQMKDNFLAMLSHELRTPLNATLGWAQLMRSGRLPPTETERALEIIDRNIRAQTRLVSDLLDMSRIISGKLSLELGRIDLNAIIISVVENLRVSAESADVRIRSDLDSSIPQVVADASRLEQILSNLISNAIKFSYAAGEVRVCSRCVDGSAEIEVEDRGIGILPEFLPYVFDRFRQADASKTRRHGGLGLGLSIVRHLVEAHGGTISAGSKGEGQGSRFVVRLPIARSGTAAQNKDPGAPEQFIYSPDAIRGVKVLVVDDNADSRGLIARQLGELDAVVIEAGSARDAIRKFRNFLPDVIVSDIGMPDEDGYELIRKIRSREIGRAVPAIALTAFARPEDKEEAMRAGYQAHLGKPVEIHRVARTIARLTRRFPAAPPIPAPRDPPREPDTERDGSGLRVLVVDDSEDSAGYIAAALEFQGHTVFTAHDGTSAVEIATRFLPDVVLLDIGLPDIDGFEVAGRIREQPGTDMTVIAAVSGFVIDRGLPEASAFDHFLQKPLDPDTLLSFVQTCGRAHPPPAAG